MNNSINKIRFVVALFAMVMVLSGFLIPYLMDTFPAWQIMIISLISSYILLCLIIVFVRAFID